MATKNKLISVLSDAEQVALYGLPDFDDGQRWEYLARSESERALACSRPRLHAQAYCAVQIGYFTATQAFFRFTWDDAPDDRAFVLTRYFEGQLVQLEAVTVYEQDAQRALIAALCGYPLWTSDFLAPLTQHAAPVVRRDVTPGFVVADLIVYLNEHKIVRPGDTTLQTLISAALATERRRLEILLAAALDAAATEARAQLLVRDDTLSALAALKQDAKSFGWRQMAADGPGAGEARHARAPLSHRQDRAAHAGHLAAESTLLRESGALLHDLRPAPPQAGTDPPVPAVRRLAALSAAHRQSRRRRRLAPDAD